MTDRDNDPGSFDPADSGKELEKPPNEDDTENDNMTKNTRPTKGESNDNTTPLDTLVPVTFDLTSNSDSIKRAREIEYHCRIDPSGKGDLIAFADSDTVHRVRIKRTPNGREANCWTLDDDGKRKHRCKGFAHHEGPCAHLYAVRQVHARRRQDPDTRHDVESRKVGNL